MHLHPSLIPFAIGPLEFLTGFISKRKPELCLPVTVSSPNCSPLPCLQVYGSRCVAICLPCSLLGTRKPPDAFLAESCQPLLFLARLVDPQPRQACDGWLKACLPCCSIRQTKACPQQTEYRRCWASCGSQGHLWLWARCKHQPANCSTQQASTMPALGVNTKGASYPKSSAPGQIKEADRKGGARLWRGQATEDDRGNDGGDRPKPWTE